MTANYDEAFKKWQGGSIEIDKQGRADEQLHAKRR